ncbi:hypothetical protein MOSE0_J09824 [Monosporozyma servazzii]
MTLPCDSVTGLCDCTANMASNPVIVNTTTFTPENLYKCGYFVGINSGSKFNSTVFTSVTDEYRNETGWYCGGKTIYSNGTKFNPQDMYDCGKKYGKQFQKKLGNGAMRSSASSKTVLVALLLFFSVYFF